MGRPAMNLSGKQFDKLRVLGRIITEDNRNSYWLCECECGNKVILPGISLKSGRTLSCGCLNDQKRRERFIDKTGQKFGKLKVIEKLDKKKHGKIVWKCECECGNICEVATDNLGVDTFSCGCTKSKLLLEDCVEDTRLRNLTAKKRKRKNKDSGVKGVVWSKKRKKWVAQIGFQGKTINLGRYDDIEDAIKARKEAEKQYFKPILDKYKEKDD